MTATQNPQRILDASECLKYLLAGRSKVTLKSNVSGVHLTYSIVASSSENPIYFVYVKYNPEGDGDYIGFLNNTGFLNTKEVVNFSRYANASEDSKSIKAIRYLVKSINRNKISEDLEVLKSNLCCKCARVLTTPESILEGIGPECKKFLISKGKW